MIVDSHCHLDFEQLSSDIAGVIQRADEANVKVMQTICTKISEFEKIHSIAKKYTNIFCSVGNHPLNLNEEGLVKNSDIIKLTKKEKVIGIGETGLDFHYSKDNKQLQTKSFEEHIIAAQTTSLPLIIHTREADQETVDILEHHMKEAPFSAVIHCFTASKWLAFKCLDMGLYISASGIITFKNATDIQETFKQIPIDRILIETDAPFLAPIPFRGKTNEPSYLKHTALFLANLLNKPFEEISLQTTKNFFSLFTKAKIN
ncbi:MAG: TatD DNase family protein [Candidatus Midichloriaceae bacterium]|jgi:TatD DNase family protein